MNIKIVELKSVISDANIYAPNRVTIIYEIHLDGKPLPSNIRPHPIRYGTHEEAEAFVKGFKLASDRAEKENADLQKRLELITSRKYQDSRREIWRE